MKPFTEKDHIDVALTIKSAEKLIGPLKEKIWKAYGVHSKASRRINKALHAMTCELCSELDNRFFDLPENERIEKSPYYNLGIVHHN